MVTLKEIAQRCGVSAMTVSNILNGKTKASEETRRLVLETVKEMGYKPNYMAQSLRSQKTRTIAIIAEDIVHFTMPEIIEAIMASCEERGYRTILQNLRLYARWQDTWYDKDAEYHSILDPALQESLSLRVDGIIYLAGHARVIHCFPEDFSLPAVMAYAYSDSVKVPSVVVDEEKGGYDVAKYLISMGHEKIGVISGRADNIHSQKRIIGIQKALFEERRLFNPDWIYYGNWLRKDGYEGAKRLLKHDITAIFCMNELMAGGVYDYLEEVGLKPGIDLSVMGHDDRESAEYFRPALTTMRLPGGKIGWKAAEILLDQLEGKKDLRTEGNIVEIGLPSTLVERGSVRNLRL